MSVRWEYPYQCKLCLPRTQTDGHLVDMFKASVLGLPRPPIQGLLRNFLAQFPVILGPNTSKFEKQVKVNYTKNFLNEKLSGFAEPRRQKLKEREV